MILIMATRQGPGMVSFRRCHVSACRPWVCWIDVYRETTSIVIKVVSSVIGRFLLAVSRSAKLISVDEGVLLLKAIR